MEILSPKMDSVSSLPPPNYTNGGLTSSKADSVSPGSMSGMNTNYLLFTFIYHFFSTSFKPTYLSAWESVLKNGIFYNTLLIEQMCNKHSAEEQLQKI